MTAASTSNLLSIRKLTVSFPAPDGSRLYAVRDLDLDMDRAQIMGLAGESGSGKSLTSLAILGLLPPGARVSGRILHEGTDILALGRTQMARLRGRRIAMVFQDPMTALHPMLSIGRQMTEHYRHHFGGTAKAARHHAEEMLHLVRIPDPAGAMDRIPQQFSGGMRQRIAIAMALCCQPDLLIADEPTTALDVTVQAGILRLLERLRRELDLAVLMITHDLGVISAIADTVSVMYAGRVVESGARASVMTAPRHPYTHGLLRALPGTADVASGAMEPIAGLPPAIASRPPGCAFHPRCNWAEASCRAVVPALHAAGSGRMLACGVDPLKERADEPT